MEWHNIPDSLIDAVSASLLGTANESKKGELNEWLAENDSNRLFYDNIKKPEVLAGMLARLSSYDTESALILIKSRLESKRRRRSLFRKAAATAAACIAAGIFLLFSLPSFSELETSEDSRIITGTSHPVEDINFISGSRSVAIARNADIVIGERGNVTITGSENEDIATIDVAEAQELRLVVPRGRRSSIVLPDGTKVSINAGTTLKFPSKFAKNERRIQVEGEIFVDAAHDPSRPFFVEAGDMTIKVLGTQFNVSCYAEEAGSSVVLVDGSVEVSAFEERRTMEPGQMCRTDNGKLSMQKIDTEEYVSWKDGYILLPRKMPVSEVLTKIERYYNVNFSCSDRGTLADRTCWGKLMLAEDMENILKAICLISGTTYERDGDAILIKADSVSNL